MFGEHIEIHEMKPKQQKEKKKRRYFGSLHAKMMRIEWVANGAN